MPQQRRRVPAARRLSAAAASASADSVGTTRRSSMWAGSLVDRACRERRTNSSTSSQPAGRAGLRSGWAAGCQSRKWLHIRPRSANRGTRLSARITRCRGGCKTIVMRLYRDRAVLRQHVLGEADRIVTLLTRDHGWSAWPKVFDAPAANSARAWSRYRVTALLAATSTSSPRSLSTRSPPTSSPITAATPADARYWKPPNAPGRGAGAPLRSARSRWARCGRRPMDSGLTCCWTPICCAPWASPAGHQR